MNRQELFAANAHSVAEKLELSETCEVGLLMTRHSFEDSQCYLIIKIGQNVTYTFFNFLVSMLKMLLQYQNFHSVDLQEEELDDIFNKIKASRKIETSVNNFESTSQCLYRNLQEDYNPELGKSTRVRCLNEFLNESQLDTSSSIYDTREDVGTVNFSNQTLSLLQSSEKNKEN